jgi:outer membrane protein OmpA-like peptidoglycan-associated protein
MNKHALSLLFGLMLFGVLLGNVSAVLADDETLLQQSQEIITLQRRAEKLVSAGLDPNNYHLAKARTWLDLALSESYDNDNTGIIPAAIAQAVTLLDALEQKQAAISMDTPAQVPGSEAVRSDLWDKIATLKKHGKFSCGQRPIAEAEVYLVWSGHEKAESGWSHAESYVRAVEDRIYSAQVAIDNCADAPTVALPPQPLEKITLASDALFAFNQATLEPSALSRLDGLADKIKSVNPLEEVVLVGHTDRLRSDGHQERNQLLSEQRAESIKQYLIGKGIPTDKIHTFGAGSSQPIVQCPDRMSKEKQVICLRPNRRVEIVLRGGTAAGDNTAGDNKDSVK